VTSTPVLFCPNYFSRVDAIIESLCRQDQAPFWFTPVKRCLSCAVLLIWQLHYCNSIPQPNSPLLTYSQGIKTWGTPEQLGLEVELQCLMLSPYSAVAPERLIMARSIWAEGATLPISQQAWMLAVMVYSSRPQDMLASDNLSEQVQSLW